MDIPFRYLCNLFVTLMKQQRETNWTWSSHLSRREEPELWWCSFLGPGTKGGQEHTQEPGMEEMAVSSKPSSHLSLFLFYWWQIE